MISPKIAIGPLFRWNTLVFLVCAVTAFGLGLIGFSEMGMLVLFIGAGQMTIGIFVDAGPPFVIDREIQHFKKYDNRSDVTYGFDVLMPRVLHRVVTHCGGPPKRNSASETAPIAAAPVTSN